MSIKKAAIIAAAVIGLCSCFPREQTVEYEYTVESGDTLWGICDRVNGGRENLNALVYNTRERNGITDSRKLAAGQVIRIPVKLAEK